MSYFLWIEDFENYPKVTASEVLGGIVEEQSLSDHKQQLKNNLKQQGVFVELSFQDGLGFIRNHLQKIDYIILDIDLPAYSKGDEINADVLHLLEQYYGYDQTNDDEALFGDKCKELKEVAGYHIYTELVVQLGFPKEHILFCSNHGENLKSIQDAFKIAKITLPTIYQKSNPKVQAWVVEKHENPYSRLRRGIIEGCQYLRGLPEEKLRFNEFIKKSDKSIGIEDIYDYLGILENFFPLHHHGTSLHKLFIRVLAHEWDVAEPKLLGQKETFAFSSIMKMARNWSAHGNVFDKAKPQDVAYLFIINMRTMFDLGNELLPYEKYLLCLFNNVLTVDDFKIKIGTNFKDRKIPLTQNYASVLNKYGNNYEAISYNDILNALQRSNKIFSNDFFMKGLYQVFWFLTSYGHVHIDLYKINDQKYLNYKFRFFDYSSEYIFEIGRHIYNYSFPEA